ncbi:hypothetical protein P280DRAFT_540517 [Massarina eburnea CBS 473.64]|uniref:HTH APSES-type domain-containing protein n=1 Tax=Massarina eburnea CBS 473.64 TaxID=1395130 RepID=A0A6A6S899_9PLEO|nr:hypothetical protein P280DRAFT_540517 [Massarina eburnea CBS 473.64]
MNIRSLLNPLCGSNTPNDGDRSSESPPPRATAPSSSPYAAPLPKRQKVAKDAPVFSEGTKTVGFVNYPPYEAGNDEHLAAQHKRFRVFPLGEIQKVGVRHIPYNSDKKDFMEKTGRDAFEMFQYVYYVPGEEKEYTVVWDYNVGLVRMTPFFKSLKYTKTVPAKALRENPGLKDISYSITGGALVCQGYWMPYHAAKAISATFCHAIRYALTPVFGPDFPSLCLTPKDPNFGKFVIDPDIVRMCVRETDRFRVEGASYQVPTSLLSTDATIGRGQGLQFSTPPWSPGEERKRELGGERSRTSEESRYSTESDYSSDKYLYSPQVSPRSTTWTSVNRSQSPTSPLVFHSPTFKTPNFTPPSQPSHTHHHHHHRHLPPYHRILPTSVPGGYYEEPLRTKRTHSKVEMSFGENLVRHGDGIDRKMHSQPQTGMSMTDEEVCGKGGDGVHSRKELDAAEIILQLSTADMSLPPTKRLRRGNTD